MAIIPSLREMCKLEVIKHGVDRTDLPATLAVEVEQLEELFASTFSGTYVRAYCTLERFRTWVIFSVAWRQGHWEFTKGDEEAMVVRPGMVNEMGRAGGDLFCLPGREVTITDFRIDLDDGVGVLTFFGTCSSNRSENNRTLKIILSPLSNQHPHDRLLVETFLTSEDDVMYSKANSKVVMRSLSPNVDIYDRNIPSDYDSDSSVDFDSDYDYGIFI